MSNRRLMVDSKTLEYVLDTYSEYIDNLQIAKLKELLKKDKHHYGNLDVVDIVSSIMQLIIDECGSDIVNDERLKLPFWGFYGYYTNVVFDYHVEITRDIADSEFSQAKFNDGVTIYAKTLPQQAIASTDMQGLVDLPNVVELHGFNFNFANDTGNITVKLSKDLKIIDCYSFTARYPNIEIEYPGTVQEFSDMIFENFESWPDSHKRAFDEDLQEEASPKIKCLDGTWDYEVFVKDQRYKEWTKN